jgi:hypothetical protein
MGTVEFDGHSSGNKKRTQSGWQIWEQTTLLEAASLVTRAANFHSSIARLKIGNSAVQHAATGATGSKPRQFTWNHESHESARINQSLPWRTEIPTCVPMVPTAQSPMTNDK